jgi:hypothetical protein
MVAGCMSTEAEADAIREESGLADTSTMTAFPSLSKWFNLGIFVIPDIKL